MTNSATIIAVNQDQDFCTCCGKSDLKKVVWVEFENGVIEHFGSTCAQSIVSKKEGAKASALSVKNSILVNDTIKEITFNDVWAEIKVLIEEAFDDGVIFTNEGDFVFAKFESGIVRSFDSFCNLYADKARLDWPMRFCFNTAIIEMGIK